MAAGASYHPGGLEAGTESLSTATAREYEADVTVEFPFFLDIERQGVRDTGTAAATTAVEANPGGVEMGTQVKISPRSPRDLP